MGASAGAGTFAELFFFSSNLLITEFKLYHTRPPLFPVKVSRFYIRHLRQTRYHL